MSGPTLELLGNASAEQIKKQINSASNAICTDSLRPRFRSTPAVRASYCTRQPVNKPWSQDKHAEVGTVEIRTTRSLKGSLFQAKTEPQNGFPNIYYR